VIPGLVLALREGLEAALIIGIILGTLRKLGRADLRQPVWLGTLGALGVSLLVGIALTLMGARLEGKVEEIFEGMTMFVAAGVLTWAILWMRNQAYHRTHALASGVESAIAGGGRWGLISLAFIAVVREGIELSLFLTASALSSGVSYTVLGALIGLLAALGLGWAAYSRLIKLDLRYFFLVTGGLLILFAAGLVAHGIHEFIAAGWIPGLIEPVWNIDPLLPESSFLGQLMKALLGYNSEPSLTEIIGYIGYSAAIAYTLVRKPVAGLQTADGSAS
jgi:high-affinity iron transporter